MKLEFDAGALRPIGVDQMKLARDLAARSQRARAIVRYHEYGESLQRMVHAIEPDSYVRPHRHTDPEKTEVFLALAGAALVCCFDDAGRVTQRVEIRAGGPQFGCEIPPPAWHGLFALEPGTVLFELVDAPFDPGDRKDFVAWAPEEGSAEATAFHAELRRRVGLS